MIRRIRKIMIQLINSWIFMIIMCVMIIGICIYITCKQVPMYLKAKENAELIAYYTEINTEIGKLRKEYHNNSIAFCNAVYESSFMNNALQDIPIEEYSDLDIEISTMNIYFDKYFIQNDFSDNSNLDEEVTIFISIYKDILMTDENISKIILDRESIYLTMNTLMSIE